jgi:hypothetical protein
MTSLLRLLQLLALAVWNGGICFLSFVLAPAAFALLPSPATAGTIVRTTLTALHLIGLGAGALVVVTSFVLRDKTQKALRNLVFFMMLLTGISQFGVMSQMQRIRDAVGTIEVLPPKDAGRAAFDRLHLISETLEGLVLLAGIGCLAVLARERRD